MSILGDAREEMAARGTSSRAGSAALWYWGWVLRFALTYRWAGHVGGGRHAPGLGWVLRQAVRTLSRRPWMSLAVVSTLAVGLGTTTLAIALVDGLLLKPLPYPEAEELVDVSRANPEWFGGPPSAGQAGGIWATPPATFFDWQRLARSYRALGAYAYDGRSLTGAGDPVRVLGIVATSGVFEALDVPPLLGRYMLPEDDALGAPPVVVLRHGFWMRRFGGNADVLGSELNLDGVAHTVIGVMPEDFVFPDEDAQFWVAFDDGARSSTYRNAGYLHAVARLAPGVTLEEARAEMADITARLAEVEPVEQDFQAYVFRFREQLVAGVRPGLMLLLGAAVVVLLVGCANVTSLLLSRVTERRREFAVHSALGAGRGRLAALVLGESLTLAVLGGLAGFALAGAGLRPFLSALPMAIPRASEIGIDLRAFMAMLALSVVTGILPAVLPAVRSGRIQVNATLRDGGHGSTGGRRTARAHGLLVVAEVALAVVLLSTSGLFVQSYLLSLRQDRGYATDDLLTMGVYLPATLETPVQEFRTFFDDLVERTRAIPGVTRVGLASQMPLGGAYSTPPASVETADGIRKTNLHAAAVTPSYFEALGIPLIAGRGLLPTDRAGTRPVIVVSEAMARRWWPGESPLGRRVRFEDGEEPFWREVVGVVGSVRYDFGGGEEVEYYRPWDQEPEPYARVLIRTEPGATGVAAAAIRAAHQLDPTLPLTVNSLAELARRDGGYRWARVAALVLAVLAGAATLLAILGVYAVLALGVVQRTREIGIRVSLGGARLEILRAVLGRGLLMAAIGAGLGLALAAGSGRVVRAALVGVSPADQWVLVCVVGVIFATAAMASLAPALRAVRVDPLVAFHAD